MTDNQNPAPKPADKPEPKPAESEATKRSLEFSSANETYAWFQDGDQTVVGIDRKAFEKLGEPDTITVTIS